MTCLKEFTYIDHFYMINLVPQASKNVESAAGQPVEAESEAAA